MIGRIHGPTQAADAGNAIRFHLASMMSETAKTEIFSLLDVRASLMDAECKNQEWHMDFWPIMPAKIFSALSDSRNSQVQRMYILFEYLANSKGLRVPSEKTFGAMLALNYYVELEGLNDYGRQMYDKLHGIKSQWKAYMMHFRRVNPECNIVWTWPGVDEGEENVQLDTIRFMMIFHSIPLRSTNVRAKDGDLRHIQLKIQSQRALPYSSAARLPALPAPPPAAPLPGLPAQPPAAPLPVLPAQPPAAPLPVLPAQPPALPAPPGSVVHQLALPDAKQPVEDGEEAGNEHGKVAVAEIDSSKQRKRTLAQVTRELQENDAETAQKEKAAKDAKKEKEKTAKAAKKEKEKAAKAAKKEKEKDTKDKDAKKGTKDKDAKKGTKDKDAKKGTKKDMDAKKGTKKDMDAKKGTKKDAKKDTEKDMDAKKDTEKDTDAKKVTKDDTDAKKEKDTVAKDTKKDDTVAKELTKVAKDTKKKDRKPSSPIRALQRTGSPRTRKCLYWKHGCSKCVWKAKCTNSCWRYRNMEMPTEEEIEAFAGSDVD